MLKWLNNLNGLFVHCRMVGSFPAPATEQSGYWM
jgi:hypothetical protein